MALPTKKDLENWPTSKLLIVHTQLMLMSQLGNKAAIEDFVMSTIPEREMFVQNIHEEFDRRIPIPS